MTIVPTKVSLISGVAVVASVGVLLTLVHRPATADTAYHADTSTSADITPAMTSLGTPQISVNGQELPVNQGTTTVPTPNGAATVTVFGDSATVSTSGNDVDQTTNTPSGNVHIQIHTSSSGNNDATSFQHVSSHSSVSSSSNSDTSVSASGTSHVTIEAH